MAKERPISDIDPIAMISSLSSSQMKALVIKSNLTVNAAKPADNKMHQGFSQALEEFNRDSELAKLRRRNTDSTTSLTQEESEYLAGTPALNKDQKTENIKDILRVSRSLFKCSENDERLSEESGFYKYLLTHRGDDYFSETMFLFINYISTLSSKSPNVQQHFLAAFPPLESSGELNCFDGSRMRLQKTYSALLSQSVDTFTKVICEANELVLRPAINNFYPEMHPGNEVHLDVYIPYVLGLITSEEAKNTDGYYLTPHVAINPQKMHHLLNNYTSGLKEKIAETLNDAENGGALTKEIIKIFTEQRNTLTNAIEKITKEFDDINDVLQGGAPDKLMKYNMDSQDFEDKYGFSCNSLFKEEDNGTYVWDPDKINEVIAAAPLSIAEKSLSADDQAVLSDVNKILYSTEEYELIDTLLGSDSNDKVSAAVNSIWVMGEEFTDNRPLQFLEILKETGFIDKADAIKSNLPQSEHFRVGRIQDAHLRLTTDEKLKAFYDGTDTRFSFEEFVNQGYPVNKLLGIIKETDVAALQANFSEAPEEGYNRLIKEPYGESVFIALKSKGVTFDNKYLRALINASTYKNNTSLTQYFLKYVNEDNFEEILSLKEDDTLTPAIHLAAQNNNTTLVKLMLEKGATVDQVDKNGWTPLYVAAYNGHIETVKFLFDKGADVNTVGEGGKTPLFIAAQEGHTEVVKALIDKGANVNQAGTYSIYPLSIAAQGGHIEVVKALLDKGANVNQANKEGASPLFIAAGKGHTEVVKALLDKGANVNQTNKSGFSPLKAASYGNKEEAFKTLLKSNAKRDKMGRISLAGTFPTLFLCTPASSPNIRKAEKNFKYFNYAAKAIIKQVHTKDPSKKTSINDLKDPIRNALLDAYDFDINALKEDFYVNKTSDFKGKHTMQANPNIQAIATNIYKILNPSASVTQLEDTPTEADNLNNSNVTAKVTEMLSKKDSIKKLLEPATGNIVIPFIAI